MLYVINSVRTNNFTDPDMIDKIKALWQQAQAKLVNYSGSVYGIYHEYQNDYRGDYTLSIGVDSPFDGASVIELNPLERYRIFDVKDNHEDNVYQTWENIWGLEQNHQLFRTYDVDFEKYSPDGKVEIFIGSVV